MKPIIEYNDYRLYMRDFYEERKRTSYFTWREFASLAGFVSPTYLKLVCDGNTRLSKPGIAKVARAMGLEGFDYTYFGLLVKFGNAKSATEKEEALRELGREASMNKIRILDADAFRYYEMPTCPIVRELAPLMPGATPRDIAEECKEYVSAEEVRDVLNFLVKAGFLKKDGEKVYSQTEQTVIGSQEALPIAIRAMHKEMANMAVRAVDRYSVNARHFTGVTLSVNQEASERIAKELDACCRRVLAIANEYNDQDQVCRINFQFFPVTEKVKEVHHA